MLECSFKFWIYNIKGAANEDIENLTVIDEIIFEFEWISI